MADQPRTLTDRLRAYVAPGAVAAQLDEDYLSDCINEATGLVNQACNITPATETTDVINPYNVPATITDRAILEAASELFHRSKAPNGITQFATPDGNGAVRVARDPMVAARPILAPFLPWGFA